MARLDYKHIDNPYDNKVSRDRTEYKDDRVLSPSDLGSNVLDGKSFNNVWIENWIKSRNFKPRSSGFYLDGKTGYAEFSNVLVRGRIEATEGYFGDSTNGVLVDSTGLTLTGTGYIRTASSGQRVEIDTSGLTVYDSGGNNIGEINGDTGSGVFIANISSATDTRGLYIIANKTDGTSASVCVATKGDQVALVLSGEKTTSTTALCKIWADGNQLGLYVANGNIIDLNNTNNLSTSNLVSFDVNSSHASRLGTHMVCRMRSLNKGGVLETDTGTSATGPSIRSTHSASTASYGWHLTFDNNNNANAAVYIEKTSTGAGEVLKLDQSATIEPGTGVFKKIISLAGVTLYISDGTNTPNGNLTGTAGDICFGADSGKAYYCTGTTNWTAM